MADNISDLVVIDHGLNDSKCRRDLCLRIFFPIDVLIFLLAIVVAGSEFENVEEVVALLFELDCQAAILPSSIVVAGFESKHVFVSHCLVV